MKKALYVATVVKNHIMEFHIPYLKMLKEMGWETAVASRNDYDNPNECVIPYCDNYFDVPFERNPFSLKNIKAYKQLKKIIDVGQYDIIHCHTPVGAAITRLAATDARKKGTKVVYTAHGFHFYKGAPLINWLVYYPVEKCLAKKTDVLITINKEDYARAISNFAAPRIEYIPGVGIDVNKFSNFQCDVSEKRQELGIRDSDFVILSVGELIKRKNHQVVIKALAELKNEGRLDEIQYLICGTGVLGDDLKKLATDLGVADHVHFLGYRNDICAICNCSDAFVFMSIQEGLPVALMEAMACGLPVICSRIRGNTDLICDGENGIFSESTPNDVANAIVTLIDDDEIRGKIISNGLSSICDFKIENVMRDLKELYNLCDIG